MREFQDFSSDITELKDNETPVEVDEEMLRFQISKTIESLKNLPFKELSSYQRAKIFKDLVNLENSIDNVDVDDIDLSNDGSEDLPDFEM